MGAAAFIAPHRGDRLIGAAELFPVGYLTGIDAADLINTYIRHRVIRIDYKDERVLADLDHFELNAVLSRICELLFGRRDADYKISLAVDDVLVSASGICVVHGAGIVVALAVKDHGIFRIDALDKARINRQKSCSAVYGRKVAFKLDLSPDRINILRTRERHIVRDFDAHLLHSGRMVTDNSLDEKLIDRDIEPREKQDHKAYYSQLPLKFFLIHGLTPVRDHLNDRDLFPEIISVDSKAY